MTTLQLPLLMPHLTNYYCPDGTAGSSSLASNLSSANLIYAYDFHRLIEIGSRVTKLARHSTANQ